MNTVNMPDYEKILEVMLYSLNFIHATKYSTKISKLFKNLSLQLGDHSQYDFGMRSMKTFIKKLASNKKIIKKEELAIYHSLYETFYSRLNPYDISTFNKVVKDILGFDIENYEINKKV